MSEEEKAITKRILLKEQNIRQLTSKYIDLMSKFKTLTRNEMVTYINDILNEIDLIEILLLKSENIQRVESIDKEYYQELSKKLESNINAVKKDINENKKELEKSIKEKEYKISCEEISKQINNLETTEEMNKKIIEIEKENNIIKEKCSKIDKKIKSQSNKMSLLVSLINELKESFHSDEIDLDETLNNS